MVAVYAGDAKVACVMVGLPARGKTFIGRKSKVFNVGNYRRRECGAAQLHTFFDPDNKKALAEREHVATIALEEMLDWLQPPPDSDVVCDLPVGGTVGIYDATNVTYERRVRILRACEARNVRVIFVESICDDPEQIRGNVRAIKLRSPDYTHTRGGEKSDADFDDHSAERDFMARIEQYTRTYEPVGEASHDKANNESLLTYVKLINVGHQAVINNIRGYLQSRIVYYLLNLHIEPRTVFMSRHGESEYNVLGKVGGDSLLSPRGQQYRDSLPKLIAQHIGDRPITVWTSTLKRSIDTASKLPYPKLAWKALDELETGICDGLTYAEIEKQYPEEAANRDMDKFNCRYRGGESYRDVVLRLEPVIMELERQHNILIVGHQAVLRCIYAYFFNITHDELPYIKIPLHTLLKVTPQAYGCDEERFRVGIDAVDTHRPKPKRAVASLSVAKTAAVPEAESTANGMASVAKPSVHEEQLMSPEGIVVEPDAHIDAVLGSHARDPSSVEPVVVPVDSLPPSE